MTIYTPCRKWLLVALLVTMLGGHTFPLRAVEIPSQPAVDGHGRFVHDLASLLADSPDSLSRITTIQKTAFEKHDVPIIVVTITQMSAYGYLRDSIEPFAREWFNAWEIGTMRSSGGNNRGILLLVSLVDRKARIELGADWGSDFDKACQEIMDRRIVPKFKQKDYAAGITAGVKALGQMAAEDPAGTPPNFRSWGDWFMIGPTALVRVLGRFIEAFGGLAVTAIIVVVLVVLECCGIEVCGSGDGGNSSGWGGGGYSGGGYSGGGFGGGSSGGGGASGSW